jgi:hypothetical protein
MRWRFKSSRPYKKPIEVSSASVANEDFVVSSFHICRISTVVVQRFCKPKVVGSNPTSGTEMKEEHEARIGREQEFYAKCAELLNKEHQYHRPFSKRTRWNARTLSNGRFPGFGVIQAFGPFIRIMCKKGTFVFNTYDEVYDFLRM